MTYSLSNLFTFVFCIFVATRLLSPLSPSEMVCFFLLFPFCNVVVTRYHSGLGLFNPALKRGNRGFSFIIFLLS